MIVQSPETNMPEPYASYIAERNDNIANVLYQIVPGNTQLCPRAIIEQERVFKKGIVYGVVVNNTQDGLKSVLYESESAQGIVVRDFEHALRYSERQLQKGNRLRVKDVSQSDSQGQYVAETLEEVESSIALAGENCVLMPNLKEISQKISVGIISLGSLGVFCYLGREFSTKREAQEVYGGTDLGLFNLDNHHAAKKVMNKLEIPAKLFEIGMQNIVKYKERVITLGRVSIDVLQGVTDSGEDFFDAVDITPRIGGTTPAEVLAIKEVVADEEAICYASSKLIYSPRQLISSGTNFVNTDSLIINAEIKEKTR